MRIILTVAAFILGAGGGALCALHLGRPQAAGRPVSYGKQMAPLPFAVLLLILVHWLLPGNFGFFGVILLTAFALVSAATTSGLLARDPGLLEMAFVFRIPAAARMQYIDLPACRSRLVRSAQLAGPIAALLGALELMISGGENVFISQLVTGLVLAAAVTAADAVLKKKGGAV